MGVVGGGIAGEAGHDRGQDGHAEDAVGQLEELPVCRVDADAGFGGARGDAIGDDQTDLQDCDIQNDGKCHVAELAQPVVQTPLQFQLHPAAPDGGEQDRGLGDHTEGGADAQDQELGVAHADRVQRDVTRGDRIGDQGDYLYDVVEHGCPGAGLEEALHVQDGDEQRRQPVEQHRGQQQERECGGEVAVDLAVTEVEHRERGSSDQGREGGHPQHGHRKGEDSVDESHSPVRVFGFGAYQYRDHDGGQDGTEDHLGDHVGQYVGGLERGSDRGAEQSQHQDRAYESGDA